MKTFTDATGKTWTITINTNAIKRAKDTAGVYLVDVVNGDLYERLLLDPVLVCDIAYGVCKPEADTRKFTREDFNAVLVGDAIAAAREAIMGDLVDFFPNPIRSIFRKALVGTPDGKENASGGSSGSSPAPAAATPAT
ncbi:MAG: hypothetical protein NT049_18900 [Planctomycetota bacterium]|nr:hypothetical protein [Planctomycetota bacterium]